MAGCSTCAANARLKNPEKYTPDQVEEAKKVLEDAAKAVVQGKSLGEMYREAVNTPGDINEHSPKLKELASECQHVTDIGMRPLFSTVALLAGQPEKLISVAPTPHQIFYVIDKLEVLKGRTQFKYEQASTPGWDMTEETDLLFLDTKHTANQIYAELVKYAGKVRRYIVRHDTQIYGETGEDGKPGLRVGIRQFLSENPQWSVIHDTDVQYGLMVLGRDSRDKPDLPNLFRMGANFTKHLVRVATEGSDLVPDEVFQQRLDTCLMCEHRTGNQCSMCGCFLDKFPLTGKHGKAAYAVESCPLETPKWGPYISPQKNDNGNSTDSNP
jgi:hypothetical protein